MNRPALGAWTGATQFPCCRVPWVSICRRSAGWDASALPLLSALREACSQLYKKKTNVKEPNRRQLFLLELICLDSFNTWNTYISILYKSKRAVSLAINLSYDIITAGNL